MTFKHHPKTRLIIAGACALAMFAFLQTSHADFLMPGSQQGQAPQGQQPAPATPQTPQTYSQPAQGSYQGNTWVEPNALNMFYTPQALQTPQASPLAMAYKVMLQSNADPCNIMEVDPARHSFQTNDRIRFKVQPNSDGYLYIFQKGSDGSTNRLFPHPAFQQNATQVRAYHEVVIPVNGWFKFDATPGVETVYFFLSKSRLSHLESLPAAGQNPVAVAMAPQSWNTISAYLNRPGRNLTLQTDPGQTGAGIHQTPTMYAGQMTGGDQSVIIAECQLKHRP